MTFVRKKDILPDGQDLVGCSEDISNNSGIHDIGRSGQLI